MDDDSALIDNGHILWHITPDTSDLALRPHKLQMVSPPSSSHSGLKEFQTNHPSTDNYIDTPVPSTSFPSAILSSLEPMPSKLSSTLDGNIIHRKSANSEDSLSTEESTDFPQVTHNRKHGVNIIAPRDMNGLSPKKLSRSDFHTPPVSMLAVSLAFDRSTPALGKKNSETLWYY